MKAVLAMWLALGLVALFLAAPVLAADVDQPLTQHAATDLRPADTPDPEDTSSPAEPEPEATPLPTPAPLPAQTWGTAPAYDFGPVLSAEVWLWAEADCAAFGANCRMAHAILGGESKHSLSVGCGDGGASCGPGQIQAGFQTSLHNAYPQTRGWNRLVPRDNVRMVVFSVAATNWGDWRFVQAWSAYWVNWRGQCPPWWNGDFCRAYWGARR